MKPTQVQCRWCGMPHAQHAEPCGTPQRLGIVARLWPWSLRPQVRDDRGDDHPLPSAAPWGPRESALTFRQRWAIESGAAPQPDSPAKTIAVLLTLKILFAGATVALVLGGRRGLWVLPAAALTLPFLICTAMARVLRGAHARAIAAAYVTAGYCGSCGYPLGSAGVQPDGCTVCSECGAAWKRSQGWSPSEQCRPSGGGDIGTVFSGGRAVAVHQKQMAKFFSPRTQ